MHSRLASLINPSVNRKPVTMKVKVFRRVEGMDTSFMPTLDFILVDEEGTKIHASVNTQAYARFEALPEGAWAQISGAVVSTSNLIDLNHFRSPHRYMLVLPSEAKVTPIPSLSDRHFFVFTPFEDVVSGFFDISYPIDLIGTVHTVGKLSPPVNSVNAEQSIPFTIRNERDVELYCIAYGHVALQFSYEWSLQHGPVVRCLLSEWRVSQSRRFPGSTVENMIVDVGKYSRFMFDPEIPGVYDDAMDA